MELKGYEIYFYLSLSRWTDSVCTTNRSVQPHIAHSRACIAHVFSCLLAEQGRGIPFKKVTLGIKSGKDKFCITKKLTNS